MVNEDPDTESHNEINTVSGGALEKKWLITNFIII